MREGGDSKKRVQSAGEARSNPTALSREVAVALSLSARLSRCREGPPTPPHQKETWTRGHEWHQKPERYPLFSITPKPTQSLLLNCARLPLKIPSPKPFLPSLVHPLDMEDTIIVVFRWSSREGGTIAYAMSSISPQLTYLFLMLHRPSQKYSSQQPSQLLDEQPGTASPSVLN